MRVMKPTAFLIPVLLASCSSPGGWVTSSERAARDRIMLVRENPQTLGHQRLTDQSGAYPDMAKFLASRGAPDFIAETAAGDRRYMILYYLDRQSAFACRTWSGHGAIEFAGPYDMTDKEQTLLRRLKGGSIPSGSSGVVPEGVIDR